MIVWVWDAHGPDRGAAGVADNEKRARKLAAASLHSTGASEVLVEQAFLELGIKTLNYGYARTGHGWRGHRTPRGRVTWRKLPATAITPQRAVS
jgi:hypothetical protein